MKAPSDLALKILVTLVKHVFTHRNGLIDGLTYYAVAERIGRLNRHGEPHPHGMGKPLDEMGHLLEHLEDDWGEPIPKIQSLVVLKNGAEKKLPSTGIGKFWSDYPKMSRPEKEYRLQTEFAKVVNFGSRWNEVLAQLDLPRIVEQPRIDAVTTPHGKGGESAQHKALKEYVRQHPHLVGASSDWVSFVEYPLPSLDVIDVLFRSENVCVAVEVKSAVSDAYPMDYERGLYQTIKYDALLKAMAISGHSVPPIIKTVLVLQSALPQQFHRLAQILNITVLENIGAPGG